MARVNKLVPREASSDSAALKDRSEYAQWWAAAEAQAYYAGLKQRFKVQIKVPRPTRTPLEAADSTAQ